MSIPLHHITVYQCGCNIFWYRGEAAPGMMTQVDNVIMCDAHHIEYWNRRYDESVQMQ